MKATSSNTSSPLHNGLAGIRIGLNRHADVLFILLPAITLTVSFGGTRPWIWQSITGLFFLAQALHRFTIDQEHPHAIPLIAKIVVSAVLLLPVLQIVPLSQQVLTLLSPVRAHWAWGLHEFGHPGTDTLTYSVSATFQHLLWWCFLAWYGLSTLHTLRTNPRAVSIVMQALCVLAGIEAAYGILQTLVPSLGVLWDLAPDSGRAYAHYARGTFINRNHFAAFLNLVWPLGTTLILMAWPRHFRQGKLRNHAPGAGLLLAIYGLACIVLALVCSQSRGGVLAALGTVVVLALLAGTNRKRILIILGCCGVVLALYGALLGGEAVVKRFSQIEGGMADRLEIWKDGWRIVGDHPLTGTGLGTYPDAGRAYQQGLNAGQRAHHAHNDYLETLVELGFPAGGLLILGIWAAWLMRARALWINSAQMPRERHAVAVATLAALGGYLIHAWMDFNNAIPANHATVLLILVLHVTASLQPHPPDSIQPAQ